MASDEFEHLTLLAQGVLVRHPRPWRIEADWGWEVIAADGVRVALAQSPTEAQAVIEYAQRWDQEMAEMDAEGDRG